MAATCCGFFPSPARPMDRNPTERPRAAGPPSAGALCPPEPASSSIGDDDHPGGAAGSSGRGRTVTSAGHAGAMAAPAGNPFPSLRVGLIPRGLDLAGRLANDAAEVITATAGRLASPGAKAHPFDWVTETDRT